MTTQDVRTDGSNAAGTTGSDGAAAVDVVARLLAAEDDRDWSTVRDLLADEVAVDYTALSGGTAATYTAADLAAHWQQGLGGLKATQHLMGWPVVTVNGDGVTVEADLQITHVFPNDIGDPTWTVGGRYRWDLVRVSGGWRISATSVRLRWAAGNRQLMLLARGAT